MKIVWDEPKRAANVLKHGLDFADFETSFDRDTAVFLPTQPSRTGRARYKLLGQWQGRTVVVVIISPLGSEGLSLVSLRHANPNERAAYDRFRSQA